MNFDVAFQGKTQVRAERRAALLIFHELALGRERQLIEASDGRGISKAVSTKFSMVEAVSGQNRLQHLTKPCALVFNEFAAHSHLI
jgi:hypothetical protein